MFILKKIISGILTPLPLSLILSFLGIYLLWFTVKQKTGKILISVGLVILTFFSYNSIVDKMLRPLERQYEKYEIKRPSTVSTKEEESMIKFVVVLGGGHTSDPELPLMSQIGRSELVRLAEGIRIYRKFSGSKLILSGNGGFDPVSNAEIMARVAKEIGVSEEDIIIEPKAQDTKDEALFIKPIVGNEPFVLITTASHMPRSMALFKKLGMDPIPSPIGHSVSKSQRLNLFTFFPSTGNLGKAEMAIHEYLGITWAKLRGQM